MPNRARDWFNQAIRDLAQAEDSRAAGRHEWACFAAQQAAEKAVEGLHLHLGQEAWGHVVARLLVELPAAAAAPKDLVERGRVLDTFYIPHGIRTAIPKARRSSTTGRCRARTRSAMPVRSLSSSVLRWPDARTVDAAVRRWAERIAAVRPELRRAGYFGSYARGDWGPGSDLDLILIVERSAERFERRGAAWDVTELPVAADVLVYTQSEWEGQQGRFHDTVMREAVWVYSR